MLLEPGSTALLRVSGCLADAQAVLEGTLGKGDRVGWGGGVVHVKLVLGTRAGNGLVLCSRLNAAWEPHNPSQVMNSGMICAGRAYGMQGRTGAQTREEGLTPFKCRTRLCMPWQLYAQVAWILHNPPVMANRPFLPCWRCQEAGRGKPARWSGWSGQWHVRFLGSVQIIFLGLLHWRSAHWCTAGICPTYATMHEGSCEQWIPMQMHRKQVCHRAMQWGADLSKA